MRNILSNRSDHPAAVIFSHETIMLCYVFLLFIRQLHLSENDMAALTGGKVWQYSMLIYSNTVFQRDQLRGVCSSTNS